MVRYIFQRFPPPISWISASTTFMETLKGKKSLAIIHQVGTENIC